MIRRGVGQGLGVVALLLVAVQLNAQTTRDADVLSLDSLLDIHVSAASRYEQSTASAPASVVIITGDEIRDVGYRSLAEVLNSVPGFYVSNDRNYTYIGVRGFSRPTDYNNRVLLLLNGQRLNEAFFGSANFDEILGLDMRHIDRVEIIRGPGSVLYGTSAMFAVVNIITAGPEAAPEARVGASIGSGALRRISAGTSGTGHGLEYNASALYTQRDGLDQYYPEYDTPAQNHGIAQNLDWERARSAFLWLKYRSLTVQTHVAGRQKGFPTAAWSTVFNDPRTRTSDGAGSVDAQLDVALDPDKQLALRAHYDRYVYQGWYPAEGGLDTDSADVRSVGAEATLTWDVSSAHRLLAGIEANSFFKAFYTSSTSGALIYDDDSPYNNVAAFVQLEWHLHRKVALYAGMRGDHSSTGDRALSPRAALVWTLDSANTIKVMRGRAYRAPNVYERDYFTVGQKKSPVHAERVFTSEVNLQHRFGPNTMLSVSAFFSNVAHLIDTEIDPADSLLFFVNRQTAKSGGGEAELQWRGRTAHLRGSYSYAYTYDASRHGWLTNSPFHVVKGVASVTLPWSAIIALDARYESGRKTVQGTLTSGGFLTDVMLHLPIQRNVEFMLNAHNVFDHAFYTPGGLEHRQAAIQQDGRMLGVQLEWHK